MRFVMTTGFCGVGIYVYPRFVCCKSTPRFLSDASNYFFCAIMKGSVTGEWVCEAAGDSGHWKGFVNGQLYYYYFIF